MALTWIRRLPVLGRFGIQGPAGPTWTPRTLRTSRIPGPQPTCVLGSRHLSTISIGQVTTKTEPSLVSSSSVGLHREPGPLLLLTQQHRPSPAQEEEFQGRLRSCSSSRQVFTLLRSAGVLSDSMGAAALHRVADLEQDGDRLQDPAVLEQETVRALCLQLERDSVRLTDSGLVSALLACTRLFLDPWSTLMVRLVSESQERLDGGRMSVQQLCVLGRALLALQGPGCVMLDQAMRQIQAQDLAKWSIGDLQAVYGLLQGGAARDGRYGGLLNAMHAHAVAVAHHMDPAAVSGVLGALVALNQTQATPLVISLVKQATRHVPHFADEELAAVLAAMMHFGHSDRYFVEAMERYVPSVAFTAHPETVTKVVQFLGRRNILSTAALDAVAESFVYRADDYTTGQVARHIVVFGKLGYLPPNAAKVFGKLENVLRSRFSQFQPRTLLEMLHACTLLERYPVNYVAKVFSSYFLQQLQDEGAGLDRLVLAWLTQIYMTLKLECPFYGGPKLLPRYRVKSFLMSGRSLETPVDQQLYYSVKNGLVNLLGARSYFGSKVLTPYCYTLDVEIKLDEAGYVLPARHNDEVYKRIAVCIDGQSRFTSNTTRLLGKEAVKQRHLKLLGYEVVQIPYYEFERLTERSSVVEYLHQKIFPHTFRLSW